LSVVYDFDFHPDEPTVRLFSVSDVLRLDEEAFVARARYVDVVLHHYAWTSKWFKVNVTTDFHGNLVETPPTEGVCAFAFNIDIATPMIRFDWRVFAVDLFTDVLVRADSISYAVGDELEARRAAREGLISLNELKAAEATLGEIVKLVEKGSLLAFLADTWPIQHCDPPEAHQMQRVPLKEVPLLAPFTRATWRRFMAAQAPAA
jgi:hypothetical protein